MFESVVKMKQNVGINSIIPFLVMMDMLAVSLVVPLLHQYFLLAGVTNAQQRELLSSIYSSTQIIGGLVLGMLSDCGILSRRNILLLSFLGSSISYGIIAKGGMSFWSLVISRILIGFVKQTMTVSMGIVSIHTPDSVTRTELIGRVKASATMAWIVGPSIGAYLSKHINVLVPPFIACIIFALLFVIALFLLPLDNTPTKVKIEKKLSLVSNFRSNLSLHLIYAMTSLLIFHWISWTVSRSSISSYYEQRHGIEPYERGYLSSYRSLLMFITQSFLIKPILTTFGGERRTIIVAAFSMCIICLIDTKASLLVFIFVCCPAFAVSSSLLNISLQSLVTHVAVPSSLGSVLAVLDVFQSAVKVAVPFYRAYLFTIMTTIGENGASIMAGDPQPYLWDLSSAFHWLLAAIIYHILLIRNNSTIEIEKKKI